MLNRLLATALAFAAWSCSSPQPPVDAIHPETQALGELDASLISEASGLAVSRRFPDRLYHHNDSGGGPYFFITSLSGANTQKVEIEGYDDEGEDLEDMAIGPCGPEQAECLYLGGIGDNRLRRDSLPLLIVEEIETFGPSVKPLHQLEIRYPDGPHNAEGLGVTPAGDIYVLTKGRSLLQRSPVPSRLYRLPRERIWAESSEPQTLEFIAEIDLPALGAQHGDDLATVATAFDISPDGDRFLVLTRRHAYEFSSDLAEHRLLAIPYLPGQEAAAYLPDGSGFIYTQESGGAERPQIVRVKVGG